MRLKIMKEVILNISKQKRLTRKSMDQPKKAHPKKGNRHFPLREVILQAGRA